jgi:hypothetical protein
MQDRVRKPDLKEKEERIREDILKVILEPMKHPILSTDCNVNYRQCKPETRHRLRRMDHLGSSCQGRIVYERTTNRQALLLRSGFCGHVQEAGIRQPLLRHFGFRPQVPPFHLRHNRAGFYPTAMQRGRTTYLRVTACSSIRTHWLMMMMIR